MRREASLELWKSLYKAAVRLMELAPWENFWDTDLVAIQLKDKKEPVFMSIAGRGIAGCGVTMYEGWRTLIFWREPGVRKDPSVFLRSENSSVSP